MTQTSMILAHLKAGHSITQQSAIKLCKCYRLSHQIFLIRKMYEGTKKKIVTSYISGRNKFGKFVYGSYKLVRN